MSSMNSFAPPIPSLPNSYSSCPTEHYPHIDSITALPCCMIHLKAIAISMTFVAFDLCPKTYTCMYEYTYIQCMFLGHNSSAAH